MPVNESLKGILDRSWEKKSLREIANASPSVLQGVSEKDATLLREAFAIRTVRDLATNRYFLWAQAITTLAEQER